MATITITREELLALKPCNERRDAALSGINWGACASVDAAAARAAGVPFSDVLWVASALAQRDADVGRRVRLFVADCAARVLCLYEASPGATTAPRGAIVAARRFARGEIEAAARAAARAAAWDAAWDAVRAAAKDAAWAAEESWQFDRLIARLSADEPEDWPLPALPERIRAE